MNLEYVKEQIKQEVLKNPEVENCGLIFDNDTIFPCQNISKNPKESFIINPADLEKAKLTGNIIAFYHNHLSLSDFSELDKYISEQTKLKCFLYINTDDSLKIYEPKGNYEVSYIGRPFVIGIFDCLTLICDYYNREYNIKVSDIDHPDRLNNEKWKDFADNNEQNAILLNHFQNQGFSIVNNLQIGDLILTRGPQIRGAIHICIYLGNNNILHQPNDSFSKIESYSEYYKNRTLFKLRHKNLF